MCVVYIDQRFGGTIFLHLLNSVVTVLDLRICLSETLTSADVDVQLYIPDNNSFHFLILSFRRVLYIVCFVLSNSPASEF